MRIERRPYSRSPWRLVTSDGKEVYWKRPMDHPSLGATVVEEPVCGETKTECVENALRALAIALEMLRER